MQSDWKTGPPPFNRWLMVSLNRTDSVGRHLRTTGTGLFMGGRWQQTGMPSGWTVEAWDWLPEAYDPDHDGPPSEPGDFLWWDAEGTTGRTGWRVLRVDSDGGSMLRCDEWGFIIADQGGNPTDWAMAQRWGSRLSPPDDTDKGGS